jgi:hypothetical protein
MLKKLSVALAATVLLGACDETPPPQPVMAAAPAPKVFMVFFDWDSAAVSANGGNVVKQAAAAQKAGNNAVTATGHTDKSGADAYNMTLSVRRANAVKDALVREGVPAAAVTTAGRGESQPLVQTADGVREPQNRRVEISVGSSATAGNDLAYCRTMSQMYRRNVAAAQADADAGNALAKCEAGDFAAGIPVLEKLLTDARMTLPKRG